MIRFLILLILLPVAACSKTAGREADRAADHAELLRLHEEARTAHLEKNADLLVRISPDGRMAYVIVQKSVRLTSPDSSGVARSEHTLFAWLEVYEKQAGKWTLMAVASTDRPGTPG